MGSRPWTVAGLAILVASAVAALGQVRDKEADAVLAADAAWLKVYRAKDLAKSVAFCEQASMLAPNAPIATGKDAIAKAIASEFAHDDLTWHANKAGVARSGDLGHTARGRAEKVERCPVSHRLLDLSSVSIHLDSQTMKVHRMNARAVSRHLGLI